MATGKTSSESEDTATVEQMANLSSVPKEQKDDNAARSKKHEVEIAELKAEILRLHASQQVQTGSPQVGIGQAEQNAQAAYQQGIHDVQVEAALEVDKAAEQRTGTRSSIRIPEPQTYIGQKDDTTVDDWIERMKDYLLLHYELGSRFSHPAQIKIVATYLRKDALKAYETRKRLAIIDPSKAINTVDALFSWLQQMFYDFNAEESNLFKYKKLRQITSVAQYAYELLALADKLVERPTDYSLKHRFKDGLKPEIRARMTVVPKFMQPEDLMQYMEMADSVDRQFMSEKVQFNRQRNWAKGDSGIAVDEKFNNVVMRKVGPIPEKDTPEWQMYCRNGNLCY
ncbi:protein of unknown function, partial [Taphrina deformans PYCC 5710]